MSIKLKFVFRMYNKNCGKKMFGKKMYPAPGENLTNQVVLKNMGHVKPGMLKYIDRGYKK